MARLHQLLNLDIWDVPTSSSDNIHHNRRLSTWSWSDVIDSGLSLFDHVTAVCRSVYYHWPTPSVTYGHAKVFISCRLDYCNALFFDLASAVGTRQQDHMEFSSSTATQLPCYIRVPSWSENWTVYQSVTLARSWLFLAVRAGEHNFLTHHHHHYHYHITPVLRQLHGCLRDTESSSKLRYWCTSFFTASQRHVIPITHQMTANLWRSRDASTAGACAVPRSRTQTRLGNRSFMAAESRLWNCLPF